MPKLNKIIFLILFSIPGIIISMFIFSLIESLLIPDSCDVHHSSNNWLINLLYDFPSWNGCHAYPSTFQFVLIFGFGIYLSYQFCKRILKI
ncbi:MAG: hypothetical protein DCF13_11715 [Flavobacteriaceae bacterium]|nr:MAG: hypothetical protein DCF13_11715 [Flavobacteriaceae bacterium]